MVAKVVHATGANVANARFTPVFTQVRRQLGVIPRFDAVGSLMGSHTFYITFYDGNLKGRLLKMGPTLTLEHYRGSARV